LRLFQPGTREPLGAAGEVGKPSGDEAFWWRGFGGICANLGVEKGGDHWEMVQGPSSALAGGIAQMAVQVSPVVP